MRLKYLSPLLLTPFLACSAGGTSADTDGTGGATASPVGDGGASGSESVSPGDSVDLDNDGTPDGVAVDDNGDGVVDTVDTDGDGVGDVPFTPQQSGDGDTGSGGTTPLPPGGGGTSASGGSANGSGGSAPTDDCVPNPAGGFVVEGDIVRDETNCLVWQKGSFTGPEIQPRSSVPEENGNGQGTKYDAEAECEVLELGGYTDWRLPHLGEIATIATRCKDWGNDPPWAVEFDISDNVWTATPAGSKWCVLQVSSGGSPDSSYSGGPGVRCVRGPATIADVECVEASVPSCAGM